LEPTAGPDGTVSTVPAGTIKVSGFRLGPRTSYSDIAEPELALLPEPELGVPPFFGSDEAVLSLEFEAVESAWLALAAKRNQTEIEAQGECYRRVGMIPSVSGWFVKKLSVRDRP